MSEEQVVRYVFGELNDEERADFEHRLERDPALRDEVERVRLCVQDLDAEATPCGLADRTFHGIRACASGGQPQERPCPIFSRWSLTEVVAAATAVTVLFVLFVPAILAARDASRNFACQENLRTIGQAAINYAQFQPGGEFPLVWLDEPAGTFVVRLFESGYLPRGDWAGLVACPASDGFRQSLRRASIAKLPTLRELRESRGCQREEYEQLVGGDYAYPVGYFGEQDYQAVRKRGCFAPLISDASLSSSGGELNSAHGNYRFNIVYQDQRVQTQVGCFVPNTTDNMFLNSDGAPASGKHWRDTVLLKSNYYPFNPAQPGAGL